jgi:hypothetical protein
VARYRVNFIIIIIISGSGGGGSSSSSSSNEFIAIMTAEAILPTYHFMHLSIKGFFQ